MSNVKNHVRHNELKVALCTGIVVLSVVILVKVLMRDPDEQFDQVRPRENSRNSFLRPSNVALTLGSPRNEYYESEWRLEHSALKKIMSN